MKDKKSYIDISKISNPNEKLSKYIVFNRNSKFVLGYISFLNRWKQYVFLPSDTSQFSSGCLNDIVEFLDKINEEYKNKNLLESVIRMNKGKNNE